jgi:hypothetical protein
MSDAVRRRALLRIVIAAVAAIDLLSLAHYIQLARADASPGAFAGLLSQTPITVAIAALGTAAAICFARGPGRIASGGTTLVALALLSSVHAQLFGSPWRHLYYSGLCLAGWIAGQVVARRRGAPADESYARTGALALLGAAYLNAGMSKVVFGSTDWATNLPIQATIIGQDGLVPGGILAAYRLVVVQTPALAAALSLLTVAFELAGPLMLVGRRAQWLIAGGLLAMHVNILLLTGEILYWEAMLLLAVFALVPDDVATATPTEAPVGGTLFVPGVVFLAAAAALAIGHQAVRFRQRHDQTAQVPAPPAAPRPPLRQIGPFVVGATLVDDWSIDRLEIGERGFTITLRGGAGNARFDVTCAPSEHRSPFDVGAAHIFYSNDVSLRSLQGAGKALRETVRRAAGPDEVCDAIATWCTEAVAETQLSASPKRLIRASTHCGTTLSAAAARQERFGPGHPTS